MVEDLAKGGGRSKRGVYRSKSLTSEFQVDLAVELGYSSVSDPQFGSFRSTLDWCM